MGATCGTKCQFCKASLESDLDGRIHGFTVQQVCWLASSSFRGGLEPTEWPSRKPHLSVKKQPFHKRAALKGKQGSQFPTKCVASCCCALNHAHCMLAVAVINICSSTGNAFMVPSWQTMHAAYCRPTTSSAASDDDSASPPGSKAPLALTPVHASQPTAAAANTPLTVVGSAKPVQRRRPPDKSASFPNISHSISKAAESAVKQTHRHHGMLNESLPLRTWDNRHHDLEAVNESMQPGTPTSSTTQDMAWEQHAETPWSLKFPVCKPLRLTRQQSSSDASTGHAADDLSSPCSPSSSPKLMLVCRICEEQVHAADMLHTTCTTSCTVCLHVALVLHP